MTDLARNATSIVLGEVGSRLFGFIATAYLARILQPVSFGLVSIAFAVFGYLIILVSLGIPLHGLRLVAQRDDNEREIVGDILGIRLFFSLCGLIAVGILSLALLQDETLAVLCIFYGLSIFPLAFNLEWFFQGKEAMQPVGWSRIVGNSVYVVALVVAVRSHGDVFFAPLALLLGNFAATFLVMIWYVRRIDVVGFQWIPSTLLRRGGRWREIVRRSLPIGVGGILSQVSYNLPPIVLGIVVSVTAAGLFGAAGRLVFFLLVLDRLIASLLLPAIVRYKKFTPEYLTSMLALVQKFVLVIAAPLCIGGMVLADDVVRLIYGSDFVAAAPILQVFVWYFFFTIASSVYTFGLLGIGEEKIYRRCVMYGTLAQVSGTLLGTLFLGAVGTALGFVVGEAFLFWLMYSSFNKFHRFDLMPILVKPLLAAMGMGAILLAAVSYGLMVTIPLGGCVFFALLLAVGGLTKEDFIAMRTKLL